MALFIPKRPCSLVFLSAITFITPVIVKDNLLFLLWFIIIIIINLLYKCFKLFSIPTYFLLFIIINIQKKSQNLTQNFFPKYKHSGMRGIC